MPPLDERTRPIRWRLGGFWPPTFETLASVHIYILYYIYILLYIYTLHILLHTVYCIILHMCIFVYMIHILIHLLTHRLFTYTTSYLSCVYIRERGTIKRTLASFRSTEMCRRSWGFPRHGEKQQGTTCEGCSSLPKWVTKKVAKNRLAVDQNSVQSMRQVSATLESLGQRQGRRFPRPRMLMENRHLTCWHSHFAAIPRIWKCSCWFFSDYVKIKKQ